MNRHSPADLARIDGYRIRRMVAVDALFGLRTTAGPIDATAVAMESTLRESAGLPSWIRELDAPAEYQSRAVWDYCPPLVTCPECEIALAAKLPARNTTPIGRFLTAGDALLANVFSRIAGWIDHLTARLIRGRNQ